MKISIKHLLLLLAASAFAMGNVACTDDSDHGHDHPHGDHNHGTHDHSEGEHNHGEDGHAHNDKDHDHDHGEDGHAHGGHDHAHGDHDHHGHAHIEAGPNGGRLITSVKPNLEFLFLENRRVQISEVKDDKIVPIGTQVVTLIGGDRSNPTRMEFDYENDALISDVAFPAGMIFPVILQIKASAGADAITEKFNLDLNESPTCGSLEYACTCHH